MSDDEEIPEEDSVLGAIDDSERRGAPRVGIEAEVRVHGEAAWAGVYHTADLSSTGAFLVSESPPPRGSMVQLDLHVGDQTTVCDVRALVVHVRTEASIPSARGCGVMFLSMGKEAAETLGSVIETRLDTAE